MWGGGRIKGGGLGAVMIPSQQWNIAIVLQPIRRSWEELGPRSKFSKVGYSCSVLQFYISQMQKATEN